MSNYRVIASVTAALQKFLLDAIADIPGRDVDTKNPAVAKSAEENKALVNIFLYQVLPNATWRNASLPSRGADGRFLKPPRLALDLYFLLSFYGSESDKIPQLLLGRTLEALHTSPHLNRSSLPSREDQMGKDESIDLSLSGLEGDFDHIQFVPVSLGHEELSKLWSVFFQVPYTLSVVYRCSVVLIEPDLGHPLPAEPVGVAQVGITVTTRWPVLERLEPARIEHGPEARIQLAGHQLAGETTRIRFGDLETIPRSQTAATLVSDLPKTLAAGVNTVSVVHLDPTGRPIAESDSLAFLLQPILLGQPLFLPGDRRVGRGPEVRLTCAPEILPGQSLELLLNEWRGEPEQRAERYSVSAPSVAAATDTVTFDLSRIPAGIYLVRLRIDGAASRLRTVDGRYDSPRVRIEPPEPLP